MLRGCFTNVLRALQHNLVKIYNARNHIYDENSKLKFGTWGQSMASGTRTNFQLEILTKISISAIHNFRENFSWNVSETLPWFFASPGHQQPWYWLCRICRPLSYLRKYSNYLCHINVKEWHSMLVHVYVPSERVNRFLASGDEVWLNILGEIGRIYSCLRFLCHQAISGYSVIIINDTKCKYTFNFARINSAC